MESDSGVRLLSSQLQGGYMTRDVVTHHVYLYTFYNKVIYVGKSVLLYF